MGWMQSLSLTLAFFAIGGGPFQTVDSVKAFSLKKGTPVRLRVVSAISSAAAGITDRVDLEVVQDVLVDGIVVIPKGSKAQGFVAQVMSGQMWGAGRLEIYPGFVRTRKGETVSVNGLTEAKRVMGKEVAIVPEDEIVALVDLDMPLDRDLYTQSEPASPAVR